MVVNGGSIMSSVTIDYDRLNDISRYASNAASRMDDYINDLSGKVMGKYSGITGGATSKTQDSAYYVSQKISQLKNKKTQYSSFATAVSTFSSNAQEIDRDVARKIRAAKDEFVDKHDYVDVNWWTELESFYIDLKNSCPLLNALGQLNDYITSINESLWSELKYLYKCGGGKEMVGVVLAIGGAVLAVVGAICSLVPPICGIVAICAAIGAVIAAVNAITNVVTSVVAMDKKKNGDLAWSKIYGDRDTLQDVLRETNFGNGTLNWMSYGTAALLDITKLVCDAVAIYNGIKNVKNVFKEIKISAKKGKVGFATRLKQYVFNSKHYSSTKNKTVKWRDILQKRGNIRTLRGYKATKALSIKQYESSLTKGQKLAGKIKKYVDSGKDVVKYTQKFFDYVVDGNWSFKDAVEDVYSLVNEKFETLKAIDKVYTFGKNAFNYADNVKHFYKVQTALP